VLYAGVCWANIELDSSTADDMTIRESRGEGDERLRWKWTVKWALSGHKMVVCIGWAISAKSVERTVDHMLDMLSASGRLPFLPCVSPGYERRIAQG